MADLAQRRIDILAGRGGAGQQRQALQQVLLDAFQAGLDLARQRLHQRHLGFVEHIGGDAGGLTLLRHFKLAVLQHVVLAHVAVEDHADSERQGQAAGHEVAELALPVEVMEGDDRPGHGDRPQHQQIEQDRRREQDDAGGGAGADHQEDFGVASRSRRGSGR